VQLDLSDDESQCIVTALTELLYRGEGENPRRDVIRDLLRRIGEIRSGIIRSGKENGTDRSFRS
jgi:HEPN domain-containing protein